METVPTVEVTGPAGNVIINESDLLAYTQRGYKILNPVVDKLEEEKSATLADKTKKVK